MRLKQDNGDKGGSFTKYYSTNKCLSFFSSLLYSAFIVLDNISLLSKLTFLKINDERVLRWSHLVWFLATLISSVMHSLKLLALVVKEE